MRRADVPGVLKHELVADGDDGRTMAAGDGVESGDGLEEIDDEVGLMLGHEGIETAENAGVFGKIAEDPEEGLKITYRPVVLVLELQRRQLDDGHFHRRFEVCRYGPLRAHAERHGDDLMTR